MVEDMVMKFEVVETNGLVCIGKIHHFSKELLLMFHLMKVYNSAMNTTGILRKLSLKMQFEQRMLAFILLLTTGITSNIGACDDQLSCEGFLGAEFQI